MKEFAPTFTFTSQLSSSTTTSSSSSPSSPSLSQQQPLVMISEELSLRALPKSMMLPHPSTLSSSQLSSHHTTSRKVSFAENEAITSQHDGGVTSNNDQEEDGSTTDFSLYQGIHMNIGSSCDDDADADAAIAPYSQMIFNEEQRVVSNETIDSLSSKNEFMKNKKVRSATTNTTNTTTTRSRSKSLPSLSRSGDLKALLIQELSSSPSTLLESSLSSTCSSSMLHENSNQMKIPSVSEDCLLSRSNSSRYYLGEDDLFTTVSQNHDCTTSNNVIQQQNHQYHDHHDHQQQQPSPCSGSGWGQFVEFIPVDHKSPKRKQLSPRSRRRNCSSSRKLLFRRHTDKTLAKKLKSFCLSTPSSRPIVQSNHKNSTTASTRRSHQLTSSLYTTNTNNHYRNNGYYKDNNIQTSASTNDIVQAFNAQLSL